MQRLTAVVTKLNPKKCFALKKTYKNKRRPTIILWVTGVCKLDKKFKKKEVLVSNLYRKIVVYKNFLASTLIKNQHSSQSQNVLINTAVHIQSTFNFEF